jgi:uncharacterized membrane protein
MPQLFTDPRRLRLLALLSISCLICLVLEIYRIRVSGNHRFKFLIWNLFLAAIPLMITNAMILLHEKSYIRWFIGLGSWLLFFPNAPYILTDLFHLKGRDDMPLWFDTAILISFAWTGLMMGFISLMDIQKMITKKIGHWSWIPISAFIFIGSFGIYLGRFLRWNSWDIITHPKGLALDMLQILIHPMQHGRVYAVTLVFGTFLFISYTTLWHLTMQHSSVKKNI